MPSSGAGGVLQKDDVILTIDGQDIGPDGTLSDRAFGRLPAGAALVVHAGRLRKPGETVRLMIARDGRTRHVSYRLKAFRPADYQIPRRFVRPRYLVLAGLVFVELSERYIEQSEISGGSPERFRYLLQTARYNDTSSPRRFVVLDRVFSVSTDLGYDTQRQIVQSVDGSAVRDLAHLKALVERRSASPIVVALEGNRRIVLDNETIARKDREVQSRYGLPFLQGNLSPGDL
jgi:hypothetical protein